MGTAVGGNHHVTAIGLALHQPSSRAGVDPPLELRRDPLGDLAYGTMQQPGFRGISLGRCLLGLGQMQH